jgi:hypothetical protein
MPSILTSAATASIQVVPATSTAVVNQTVHELEISDLVSTLVIQDLVLVAHSEANFPTAVTRASLGSEQNCSVSHSTTIFLSFY